MLCQTIGTQKGNYMNKEKNHNIIETVYDHLKKSHKCISFEDICKSVLPLKSISKAEQNQLIGDLYADMVLDDRFVLTKKGDWTLRDHLKYADLQKQYKYDDNFVSTENLENAPDKEDETQATTDSIQGWDDIEHEKENITEKISETENIAIEKLGLKRDQK